jgi:hypothetical protein
MIIMTKCERRDRESTGGLSTEWYALGEGDSQFLAPSSRRYRTGGEGGGRVVRSGGRAAGEGTQVGG